MKIEKIKNQSTKAHIKADILICRLLTDDRDHDIADGNVFMKRKRHYLFDFGVAFPQYDYDRTDGNFFWSPDFGKEADKFIDEPGSSGIRVTEFFCSIFYFLFSYIKEQKKALKLLKAKHSFLKSQYEGEEGLKLISSMC